MDIDSTRRESSGQCGHSSKSSASDAEWPYPQHYLVFEGLDTFCNITVNDRQVGYADNAFRTWIFDGACCFLGPVVRMLKSDSSVTQAVSNASEAAIRLDFASAARVTAELGTAPEAEQFPGQDEPQKGMSTTSERYEYDYRNWARKPQSDFGWCVQQRLS